MCQCIHGRPFGESGIAARATTVELQLQLLSACCWCALLRWEVPSASVENNRSPGTVPLHSGRCDPLLAFWCALGATHLHPSQRQGGGRAGAKEERHEAAKRAGDWHQGSTGADEHLHTRPSVVFGKCNRPSLSRGSPPTLDRQAVAKEAPSPASLSARRGQHLACHAVSQGLCRANTGAGEPSRVSDTAASRPQPGLGLASYHQHHDDDEAQEGWLAAQRQPRAGKRSSAGDFGTLGKGNAVWGPVFLGDLWVDPGVNRGEAGQRRTNKEGDVSRYPFCAHCSHLISGARLHHVLRLGRSAFPRLGRFSATHGRWKGTRHTRHSPNELGHFIYLNRRAAAHHLFGWRAAVCRGLPFGSVSLHGRSTVPDSSSWDGQQAAHSARRRVYKGWPALVALLGPPRWPYLQYPYLGALVEHALQRRHARAGGVDKSPFDLLVRRDWRLARRPARKGLRERRARSSRAKGLQSACLWAEFCHIATRNFPLSHPPSHQWLWGPGPTNSSLPSATHITCIRRPLIQFAVGSGNDADAGRGCTPK